MIRYVLAYPVAVGAAAVAIAIMIAIGIVWVEAEGAVPVEALLLMLMIFGPWYAIAAVVSNLIAVAVGQLAAIWSNRLYIWTAAPLAGVLTLYSALAMRTSISENLETHEYISFILFSIINMLLLYFGLNMMRRVMP